MKDVGLIAIPSRPAADFAAAVEEAWARGEAVLPVDPDLPDGEIERLLDEMKPEAAIASGVALVVPTSGTTGTPKGVELTHDALEAAARATAACIGSDPNDRWLCCLPLNHIAGLAILVRSRLSGIAPLIHDRFDVAAIERETSATLVSLVPTMLVRLLDAGVDLSRFRCILVGGAAIDPGLIERATRAGARVIRTYGMTETCGGVVYDGVALDGVELDFSPLGRVTIKGPMLMNGYRNRPELTHDVLREGWLHTADVGELDQEGRLRVLGRTDGMIITGGKKVSPREVETILHRHPGVKDVAVIGVPDDEWGQRVVAVVTPEAPGSPPSLSELRSFVSKECPSYKAPTKLVLRS